MSIKIPSITTFLQGMPVSNDMFFATMNLPVNAPVIVAPPQEKKAMVNPIKRKNFTLEEDNRLRILVSQYGSKDWNLISEMMVSKNPRQCRERWNNYLNPILTTSPWTLEEDHMLVRKYGEYGPHWSKIAHHFVNRSENSIKNRWKTLLKNSLRRQSQSSDNCSE